MDESGHYNGIELLDHPVIAVADLDMARRTFERLGFTVPPRGSHVEWGTGNLCIMFPNDYLEVRGIIDATRFTMHLDLHLEKFGEGFLGLAFGTSDVERSHEEATRHGIEVGRVRNLTRNFEHPGRWTQPAFELFTTSDAAADALMHVVVLEHLTPELLRRPDFLAHANFCTGVKNVTSVTVDIDKSYRKMRRLFGDRAVTMRAQGLGVRLPSGQTIELLIPAAYASRYGAGRASSETGGARPATLTLCTESAETAADVLQRNEVPFTRPERDRIRVPPEYACGVTLEFTD